ncbi:MAG: hypothetical protein AB1714_11395 [Acidobacteriota bacterium]
MAELMMVVVAGAAFAFMLLPILRPAAGGEEREATDSGDRSAREKREQLLDNLADLDVDLKMGKLSEHDYERNREAAQRELRAAEARTTGFQGKTPTAPQARTGSATATAAPAADSPRRCSGCGVTNPPASKFCNECGARFDAA